MLSDSSARRASGAMFAAVLVGVLLAGCETLTPAGKKIDYRSTGTAPSLEVPPDLSTPAYDDRYQATTALGTAAARAAGRPSEVLPVNPDAHVVRAGSERWLVVKATPDEAWRVLREFWSQNGFVIAIEQHAMGIMQTDWAENRAATP